MNIKTARLHRDPKFSQKKGLKSEVVGEGGWHFTTIGGIESIVSKIEAFAHTEYNKEEFKDPEKLAEIVHKGGDIFGSDWFVNFIELDNSFPP